MTKKGYIISGIILAVAAAIILIGSSTIMTSAKEAEVCEQTRHYISYEVQAEDTLWNIAENYADQANMDVREYMNELREINALTSDMVVSGTNIMVLVMN